MGKGADGFPGKRWVSCALLKTELGFESRVRVYPEGGGERDERCSRESDLHTLLGTRQQQGNESGCGGAWRVGPPTRRAGAL